MRIGVVSDTHGLFDRALLRHFSGVDHILHADIGKRGVIEKLTQIVWLQRNAGTGWVRGERVSGGAGARSGGYRVALYHRLYEGGDSPATGLILDADTSGDLWPTDTPTEGGMAGGSIVQSRVRRTETVPLAACSGPARARFRDYRRAARCAGRSGGVRWPVRLQDFFALHAGERWL